MKKIVVIGFKGQLGSELVDLSKQYAAYRFFFFDKDELDIVDEAAVTKTISEIKPDFLVNCAAYTAVDKAETDQALCYAINAQAVQYLAKACADNGTKFIHISTDYVFDGTANTPYKEDDAVNPTSVYGKTKLQGEEEALKNKDAIVLRTAWVYSTYGGNFVKTMQRLLQSKPELNVVADQVGTPTYAADLAEVIMKIIDGDKWVPGIYHFTNDGVISWFDFAAEIKNISGYTCKINPITTEQYPTPAKRPKYSVLDKSKIVATYAIMLKNWQQSLQQCLDKMPVQ